MPRFLAEIYGTWPDFSKEVKPGQIYSYVSGEFSRQTWPNLAEIWLSEIWPNLAIFLASLKASLLATPGQISSYVSGNFSRLIWQEIWPDVAIAGQISGYVKSKFTSKTWPDSWPFLAEISET